MNLLLNLLAICAVVLSEDVCVNKQCQCSRTFTNINCDSKDWTSLKDYDFPSNVVSLSLVNNHLTFNSADDRSKIENLHQLSDLSLNGNPLATIPPFDNSKIQSLSLQDTSLRSAKFPSTYQASLLRTISLSNNEIHSINEDDFNALKNSKVKKLHLDSVSLSKIDQNAFAPLMELQALSLKNNLLNSCEFLPTFRLLASIKFDGNRFTSLPQQISVLKTIKSFSFTNNNISVIDESSPLFTWMKSNATNVNISLANNPFDCCRSLWFIRFLNASSKYVHDAALLKCAQPANYAGQYLIKLHPDEMNCGGIPPSKSWWTTARIVAVTAGVSSLVLILLIGLVIFTRRRRPRSGYTEISGIDDPLPNAPPMSSNQYPFPTYGEENDDVMSSYSTAVTRNTTASQAPTHTTAAGVLALDDNRA